MDDPEEAERSPERTQSILKMVAEGAYRKATMAIIAEDSIVSGKECKTWAEALHPRSQHGAGALATRTPHSEADPPSQSTGANSYSQDIGKSDAPPVGDTPPANRNPWRETSTW